jgi:hypothetical protein
LEVGEVVERYAAAPNLAGARVAFAEAADVAVEAGAGPDSELGRRLAEVQTLLAAAGEAP